MVPNKFEIIINRKKKIYNEAHGVIKKFKKQCLAVFFQNFAF